MAGLVDYVVDSEKESDDEKPSNISRESKPDSEDSRSRSSPVKKTSSNKESNNSMKPSSSKEVRDNKESRDKNHKSNHRKQSRSRSPERERDRKLDRDRQRRRNRSKERDKRYRSKERDKNKSGHHRHHKRSRSRSRDKSHKRHKHKDDRSRHRRSSRSRSKSSSPSRDKHRRSNRRAHSQERHEKKPATIARTDVANAAGSAVADASSSGDVPKPTSLLVQAAAQQVLQKQLTQAQQQSTGVALPPFYNPGAVNSLRVAEQMQKRKLLWSHKEKEPAATTAAKLWESTAFSQDQDGKMTAKFKRLMGIKSDTATSAAGEEMSESDVLKKQKELFASLDQQYAVARAATHTQRGLGLGFSSNPR